MLLFTHGEKFSVPVCGIFLLVTIQPPPVHSGCVGKLEVLIPTKASQVTQNPGETGPVLTACKTEECCFTNCGKFHAHTLVMDKVGQMDNSE